MVRAEIKKAENNFCLVLVFAGDWTQDHVQGKPALSSPPGDIPGHEEFLCNREYCQAVRLSFSLLSMPIMFFFFFETASHNVALASLELTM